MDDTLATETEDRTPHEFAAFRRLAASVLHQAVLDARNGHHGAARFLLGHEHRDVLALWAGWLDLDPSLVIRQADRWGLRPSPPRLRPPFRRTVATPSTE